jgi:preprotein translocase SecE subunit
LAGSLQLGVQKYLYSGYFVGGVVVAYLLHGIIFKVWGERYDTHGTVIGVLGGIAAVVFAWKNTRTRTLAEETVDELAKVTWPSREETYTATVVVIVTSVVSAAIIFGLDRFWNWFTNFVYRL